jgi:hypothetical protein
LFLCALSFSLFPSLFPGIFFLDILSSTPLNCVDRKILARGAKCKLLSAQWVTVRTEVCPYHNESTASLMLLIV